MTHQAALAVAAILFAIAGGLLGYLIAEAFNREERIALQLENIHARGSLDAERIKLKQSERRCLELQAALHHRKIIEEATRGAPSATRQNDPAASNANHVLDASSAALHQEARRQKGKEGNEHLPRNTPANEATKV